VNEHPRMTAIARSFPSLRKAAGVDPWDADLFAEWAKGPAVTHGGMHAAAFVLSVWNNDPAAFGLPPFDFTRAWGTWDEAHSAALLAWAREPFWP